jgi:hypothetical protein
MNLDDRLLVIYDKLDDSVAASEQAMAAIAALTQRVQVQADRLKELAAAQQDDRRQMRDMEAQLEYVTQSCGWLEKAFSKQLDCADQRAREELQNTVIVKPAPAFPGTKVDFGKLDVADLNQFFQVPEGHSCTIVRRFTKRPTTTAGQPSLPPPRWQANAPCEVERMEVQLPSVVDAWHFHGKRQSRDAFEQDTKLLIAPALTLLERTEKAHLQQHAMGALREAGIHAGWRRSKMTWKVPGTDKWGLMAMHMIPPQCPNPWVVRQYVNQSHEAAPGVDIPAPGGAAGGGQNAGNTGGPVDAHMA